MCIRDRVSFVCLTEYDPEIPAPVAYPKEFPEEVLADVLAEAGLAQYHICLLYTSCFFYTAAR